MILKKYQPIVVVIILALVANLYSCKRTNNVVNNNKELSLSLCDSINSQGTNRILCKDWSNNKGVKKAVLFSKTTTNSKEEFFAEIFTEKRLNSPLVKVYDFIEDCPVDFSINFIEDSFSVTDINNNGIKEVSFLYEIACQGGIGPIKMKEILIEGRKKYVIRGFRLDDVSIKNNTNPNYPNSIVDKSFSSAPKVFLEYAKKKWLKNHGTKIKDYNNKDSVIVKKASCSNSKISLVLSNQQKLTFEAIYFLEDETPTISVKKNKIILSYGDDYGNFIESIWLYSLENKSIFLEEIQGVFPIKNKEKDNLKTCTLYNLEIDIKKINTDKIHENLLNSSNCTYKTM